MHTGGTAAGAKSSLAGLKDIKVIAPGHSDSEGLPNLCVLTGSVPAPYQNRKGVFEKHAAELSGGRYEKALWVDYDHDGGLALLLLGANSALMGDHGEAVCSNQTADFPFVSGHAVEGAIFALRHDTA